jgi:hypothetical protein
VLQKQLTASLDKLAAVAAGRPAPALRPRPYLKEERTLPALFAAAEAIRDEQKMLADRLQAAGDPKYWFTRVYQHVSECQIEACRRGQFQHPAWVLRLIPRFHEYYVHNLERWQGGNPTACEAHWRSAFRAMEKAARWKRNEVQQMAYAIAKGAQAHIEEDLPRSLADIYMRHYHGKCSYARFRGDYMQMANIFRQASDRLLDALPAGMIPKRFQLIRKALPDEVGDVLLARYFYNVPRERRKTFERGERLAALMAGAALHRDG